MKFTGEIQSITKDWQKDKFIVSFTMNESLPVDEVNSLMGEKLNVEAKKWRQKRSLDANSYYWQLVNKIAEVSNVSMPFVHNRNLRRYGQLEMIDGKAIYTVLPDTKEAENKIEESEMYHLKPTTQVKMGKDGVMYRTYMMLRGSSSFDTKEMSVLIDGVVSEAKAMGIETLPPNEIERMKALWGK